MSDKKTGPHQESVDPLDTTPPTRCGQRDRDANGVTPVTEHEGVKYLRHVRSAVGTQSVQTDVYAVLEAFHVTCPATQHCVKKLLAAGQRGKGSRLDDLVGALAALNRAIELERQRAK